MAIVPDVLRLRHVLREVKHVTKRADRRGPAEAAIRGVLCRIRGGKAGVSRQRAPHGFSRIGPREVIASIRVRRAAAGARYAGHPKGPFGVSSASTVTAG